jgi:hypothetical protein
MDLERLEDLAVQKRPWLRSHRHLSDLMGLGHLADLEFQRLRSNPMDLSNLWDPMGPGGQKRRSHLHLLALMGLAHLANPVDPMGQ